MNLIATTTQVMFDRPAVVAIACFAALAGMLFGMWAGTGLGKRIRDEEIELEAVEARDREIERARVYDYNSDPWPNR